MLYERNDVALRDKERPSAIQSWIPPPREAAAGSPVTEITENGIRYWVDVENGQKPASSWIRNITGALWRVWPRGKTVLDCFTHTGSFALNAAMAAPPM